MGEAKKRKAEIEMLKAKGSKQEVKKRMMEALMGLATTSNEECDKYRVIVDGMPKKANALAIETLKQSKKYFTFYCPGAGYNFIFMKNPALLEDMLCMETTDNKSTIYITKGEDKELVNELYRKLGKVGL